MSDLSRYSADDMELVEDEDAIVAERKKLDEEIKRALERERAEEDPVELVGDDE